MNWNNWPVSRRLSVAILGLLGSLLLIATGSQWLSFSSNQSAFAAVSDYGTRLVEAVRWRGLAEVSAERAVAALGTTDGDLLVAYEKSVADSQALIERIQTGFQDKASSEEERHALAGLKSRREKLAGLMKQGVVLSNKGDIGGTQTLVQSQITPAVGAYLLALDKFIALQASQHDAAVARTRSDSRRLAMGGLAACAVVVLLGIGLAQLLTRSICRPLREAVRLAEGIALGDLGNSVKISRSDEFGQLLRALDEMTVRLRNIVSEVRDGVVSVSTAASEIAAGNQELSSRTEEAASRLQGTASSMEQLTSRVAHSADAAGRANQIAADAARSATEGGALVHQVTAQMALIAESSQRIADITAVIDGLAGQTKLLSLNAAVEAARAGEQGRGFGVVATEVRALAERASEAANDIKHIIEDAEHSVNIGSELVARAGTTMAEMVERARNVSVLVSEISVAAREQRAGLDVVNDAVGGLDRMTQQNAALVEQSAAAAMSLSEQSQRLTQLVTVFRLPIESLS